MGYAECRKNTKLANDPNNTRWARDTTTFGQRILRSQGWKPGSVLGASDAAHAEFFTAASSTHIRTRLREDGLGIGWMPPNGGEVPGWGGGRDPRMDTVESLLARLNGQSETQIRERQTKREQERKKDRFEQRYGRMNFVSGGFLVGENLEKMIQEDENPKTDNAALKEEEHAKEEESKGQEPMQLAIKRKSIENVDEDETEDSSRRKKRRKEEKVNGRTDIAKKGKSERLRKASAELTSAAISAVAATDSNSDELTPTILSEQSGAETMSALAGKAPSLDIPRKAQKGKRKKIRADKADAVGGADANTVGTLRVESRPPFTATAEKIITTGTDKSKSRSEDKGKGEKKKTKVKKDRGDKNAATKAHLAEPWSGSALEAVPKAAPPESRRVKLPKKRAARVASSEEQQQQTADVGGYADVVACMAGLLARGGLQQVSAMNSSVVSWSTS